jgi:hypothetical protein
LAATSPATIGQNKHDALEFSVCWRRGLAIELFYAREFARGKAGIARRAHTQSSAEYRVYSMGTHETKKKSSHMIFRRPVRE